MPARARQQRVDALERGQLLELAQRRERELELALPVGAEQVARRAPAQVDALSPVAAGEYAGRGARGGGACRSGSSAAPA
jgi:hypothetical protein